MTILTSIMTRLSVNCDDQTDEYKSFMSLNESDKLLEAIQQSNLQVVSDSGATQYPSNDFFIRTINTDSGIIVLNSNPVLGRLFIDMTFFKERKEIEALFTNIISLIPVDFVVNNFEVSSRIKN